MEREEKKKRKRKGPDSKLFYSICMFEELQVGELWFIVVQRNYLIIFHLSPATQSCVRTRSLKMEGKVKGEKVETVLKNIKLRSCCCPRREREQSHRKGPEDTSVGFGPCPSKTCAPKWEKR